MDVTWRTDYRPVRRLLICPQAMGGDDLGKGGKVEGSED